MSAFWVPPTLRGYRRAWLGADALAALTLVAVALPSQMATARLAGLPAVVALYAFLSGSLLYAALGTKPHLSVGADSTIAPVLATAATAVAAAGSAGYAATMAFMALVVGALLIVVGLLRLGSISDFLSTPVVTGVLAGIAVEIVVRQLPVILGVKGGGTTTLGRLGALSGQIGRTNGWCVGIALGVLALVIVAQRIDHRLPGALVGLVLSIIAVDALGLASHHGVAVIGAVHGGLPHIGLPSAPWSHLRLLVAPVLTVAFVCIARDRGHRPGGRCRCRGAGRLQPGPHRSGSRESRRGSHGRFRGGRQPPEHRHCVRVGLPLAADQRHGRPDCPVGGAGGHRPIRQLPEATLGATLVFIATKLFRAGQLRTVLRFDRLEFALAVSTLVVVAFVGIEQGVALAMVLSLADRTRRTARPQDTVLGREPGTDHSDPGRHRPHDRGGTRDRRLPHVRAAVVRQRRLLP